MQRNILEGNGSELSSSEIAENDSLRSELIRQLVTSAPNLELTPGVPRPPRLLVQFWDDADSIPGDVQDCLDSWSDLERVGFERLLFDDATASSFITEHLTARHKSAFDKCMHPAMRSDYFRYCFILTAGGFYVDADDVYLGKPVDALMSNGKLKLQPLCYDLESARMRDAFGFAAGPINPDLIFYANNTPLVATPGNPIIASALERATANILASDGRSRDIQFLTGPGNLTAALVRHALDCKINCSAAEFSFLTEWESIAVSKWPLAYRSDDRNWRLWQHGKQ